MARRPGLARLAVTSGFTLIELLVVVAIIALLIAILLPSLKAARLQARVVNVHSDLRQITLALDSYAMHNRDHFPPTRSACGTNVNYQLPIELARQRYLARTASNIPQAEFRDVFDATRTYRYRAPGPAYQNGTFFDFPDSTWRPRANIWVPDDFPRCSGDEGRFYYKRTHEPPSPVDYAVWSGGPDPKAAMFPRIEGSSDLEETYFPLKRAYWYVGGGKPGLIVHFRSRFALKYTSP